MSHRRLHAHAIDFAPLRRELELSEQFPLAAQAQAERAADAVPLPDLDRTDLPFVTIDPASSRDLDQAMCLERRAGGGYRVHYAIADVAAYVVPGSELAIETWRRGQTVYLPDGSVPLHPPVLSEGAASLLPDVERAAVVWTIDVSADGDTESVRVQRAKVKSRAKLDYLSVQSDVDRSTLPDPIAILPELGRLLVLRGLARGAVNLPMPEQVAEPDGGGWRLALRAPVPAEEWNAQISLLTGRAAADIMLAGGIGLLRTMPPPPPTQLARLRVAGKGLGIEWPDGQRVGEVMAGLDPADPRAAAFIDEAAELMRGAGYTAFAGASPAEPGHSAVAAPYAHVTAPLRRLADRYASEICLALHAGEPVPEWATQAIAALPDVMTSTGRLANTAERAAIDLIEATILANRVGDTFPAVVLDTNHGRPGGTVALDQPAVRARCDGDLTAGDRITVRLMVADPERRQVRFAAID